MDKLEYSDEYLSEVRSLLEEAMCGAADTKETFLRGMTKYFAERIDEEDASARGTGSLKEIGEYADKLRHDLMSRVCDCQKGILINLEVEANRLESRVGDALFFAGLREGLALRQMFDGFIGAGGK
jgi:hypothetical protein